MLPAIIEIHQVLLKSGYTDEEADALAARLMEEEAYDFVKYIESYKDNNDFKKQVLN